MKKIMFFLILTLFFLIKPLVAVLDHENLVNTIIADPSNAEVDLFEAGVAEQDVLPELKLVVKKRFPLQVEPRFEVFKELSFSDDSYITGLCLYPDGSTLVASDSQGFIYILYFCVGEFRIIQTLETNAPIDRLEMSADGRFLVAGNQDKITIWKFNNCEYCKIQELGFTSIGPKDFCLSADGKILIIAGFYKNKLCFFKRDKNKYCRINCLDIGSRNPILNLFTNFNGSMTICAYQNESYINLFFYDGDKKVEATTIPSVSSTDFYIPGFKMDYLSIVNNPNSINIFKMEWVGPTIEQRIIKNIKLSDSEIPVFFKAASDFRLILVGYYSGGISVIRNMLGSYMIQQSLESELVSSKVEHKSFCCMSSNNYKNVYIVAGRGSEIIIYKEHSVIDDYSFDQMISFLQQRCQGVF